MIIVRITSGLGNQMYQYNFYRYLQDRFPDTEVRADITWFNAHNDHQGYELERIFKHSENYEFDIQKASFSDIFRVTGQIPVFLGGPFGKVIEFLLGPVNRILRERDKKERHIIDRLVSDDYSVLQHLDTSVDWYMAGFWVEEEFVLGRTNKVRREFVFDAPKDSQNQNLLGMIDGCDSVAVHMRRGDYMTDTYKDMFKHLGKEYYEKAVHYLQQQCGTNLRFFIFSDDPDFAEGIFRDMDAKPDYVVVRHNTGKNSFRDMQLMSRCRHHIIANSTFSQWGAILAGDDGITVYPAAYLADEDTEEKQMPGWVRI